MQMECIKLLCILCDPNKIQFSIAIKDTEGFGWEGVRVQICEKGDSGKCSMPGTTENLAFLVNKLPEGATWSVSGIGKAHMPMMLAGLALGCDGLRVGLEDNIMYGKDENGNKIIATNVMLVERAVQLAKLAGREIATAQEAREIMGITRNCLRDEVTGEVTYVEE